MNEQNQIQTPKNKADIKGPEVSASLMIVLQGSRNCQLAFVEVEALWTEKRRSVG